MDFDGLGIAMWLHKGGAGGAAAKHHTKRQQIEETGRTLPQGASSHCVSTDILSDVRTEKKKSLLSQASSSTQ